MARDPDSYAMSLMIERMAAYFQRGHFQPWLSSRILRLVTAGILENFTEARDYRTLAPWPPRVPVEGDDQHPLLIDTTSMLNAAVFGAAGSDNRVEDRSITMNIDEHIPYAETHEFGDDEKNIPPRPFFGLSDAWIDEIAEASADEIEKHFDEIASV